MSADRPPSLTDPAHDTILDRFDRAWQASTSPEVDDYLPLPGRPERLEVLQELVHVDLEYRLKRGEPVRVEHYLERYPELADEQRLVELLVWEHELRRRQEPELLTGEYARRFPHLAAALEGRLTDETLPHLKVAEVAVTGVPGYEILEELGRGGMGVVYKARQTRLNRLVALKMVLSGGHAGAKERQRFLAEAESIASIKHPGIVQIHDFGTHEELPFFALEFCAGGSLARKLASGPLPAREAATLVEQVARAMHAAHEAGIVHRDLKPGNILFGGHGQPLVTDFGLARRLAGGDALTRTGDVLGTPSYMAPEQAQGKKEVGPPADVYSLGAILYECLVGRPPFRAATTFDTLQQVVSEEPVPPRRLNSRAPADLETIVLQCLRKAPGQRYAGAAALADDLERFLAGDPIRARRVGPVERAGKWVRRNPLAATLAAVVLLVVAGVVSGGWVLQQRRAEARGRQLEADQKVHNLLERGRSLLKEGEQANDLGRLQEARVESLRAAEVADSGSASEERKQQVADFQQTVEAQLRRIARNKQLREDLLNVSAPREGSVERKQGAGRMLTQALTSADEQYAAAFRRWGLDVDATPDEEVVAQLRQTPEVVVQEVIAALDGWMLERRRKNRPETTWRRLSRLAGRLDRNEQSRQLRALLVDAFTPRAESVAALVAGRLSWPALWELGRGGKWRRLRQARAGVAPATAPVLTVTVLARALEALGDPVAAEEVLHQALAARPDELPLLDSLGRLLQRQGPRRWGEAIGCFRALRARQPRLGVVLAAALEQAGRAVEAESVALDLVRQDSDHPEAFFILGNARSAQKRLAEAAAAYRKAIQLEHNLPEAHNNLGNALLGQKKGAEAEAAYREAIRLKPGLAAAHRNLGGVLAERGNQVEAETAFKEATRRKPDYAEAYHDLGVVLIAQRKWIEAETACRQAIRLKHDFPDAHCNLGIALVKQKRRPEAVAALKEAIRLKPDYADTHFNLGLVLAEQLRWPEAEAAYKEAIRLKHDDPAAHCNLGVALEEQKRWGEAVAAYREAIRLKPDYPRAHHNLGNALVGQKKWREAEAASREAIRLKQDPLGARIRLGMALDAQKKWRESEEAYREVTRLKPDFPEAHCNLGYALRQQGKFDESLLAYRRFHEIGLRSSTWPHPSAHWVRQARRFVELDKKLPAVLKGDVKPKDAELILLAQVCTFKRWHAASARFYADAFSALPPRPPETTSIHRYNAACAAVLAGCGKGEDSPRPDDTQRTRLRQQALDWLRADLDEWSKRLGSGKPQDRATVAQTFALWLEDEDLAGVRDKGELDKLPEEERKAWRKLWADVADLRTRTTASDR